VAEVPYFGFSESSGTLGFGDINNPNSGGIFATIESPVNHVTRGLSRLPEQFKRSPKFKRFLEICLEELQEIEEVIYKINQQKSLEFAVGVQLDGIGDDVGISRNGILNDDVYRNRIAAKILINSSEGTSKNVLDTWATLLKNNNVELKEEFPAGIVLFSPKAIDDPSILELVSQAVPITVKVAVLAIKNEGELAFCFEGGVGAGFGDEDDPSIGGEFVGRYDT
jgi:hypothetical protein